MSSGKRRLDKLEVSLTPKQAILLWMAEAHRHDTMEQYAKSLKDSNDSAWPMATLPKQVTGAVEQALKGIPRKEISNGVRQAVRDVLFLFHLHQQVNGKLMEEQKAFLFRLRWLRAELGRLHYQKLAHQASPSGIRKGVLKRRDVTRWQQEAKLFLEELHDLRLAVITIIQRYFDGRDLLFPALTEGLNYLVKAMEVLVEMLNEDLAPKKWARADVTDVETRAGTAAAAQVAFLVDMAKAQALDALGETQAGIAIVGRHI
jgi:hypothetical protein